MISCEQDGCEWRGWLTEVREHEYVDHGIGANSRDCEKCGGEGEYLASRVARWDGEEDWRMCRACNGRGFVL